MLKYKDFYSHLFEKYDNVEELLSDPKNNDKTLSAILSDFEKHGGKILGQGSYATALIHPSWKYVIKIFSNDVPYIKFVRFVLKHPRPSFPKFFDKPRRIIPNYTRPKAYSHLYVVKMEKLNPITEEEFSVIKTYKTRESLDEYIKFVMRDYDHMTDRQKASTDAHVKSHMVRYEEIEKKYPSISKFQDDYRFLITNGKDMGTPDFNRRNIMKRDNGEFVLTDPYWEGENPYQTYDRLIKAEIGDYDRPHEIEPEMYRGGGLKLKTPTRKIKTSPVVKPHNDEIPF
jgi:hypothetical protein